MAELNERHRADLRSSGLTDDTIVASGCHSVTAVEAKRIVGFAAGPALAFPYLHTASNGARPYTRLKPDSPFKDGDKVAKYVSPKREKNPSGNRLYVPANLPEGVLDHPTVPLVVTEGEKKALAGCQEGFPTVGLSGVSSWVTRNGNGESHPIEDLDLVEWSGRTESPRLLRRLDYLTPTTLA